ncbi:unnamed protein product [Pieris macdunnoughi]|uniref:Major facilitator superfamily (MFS) profile domain-containing protein n=1 Tax=Pieris macdunnoughi TaxID=345717 RepID=A0A821Q5M1_9NEOP|nr:unnamed protein product [Pieris macdunnoughi]
MSFKFTFEEALGRTGFGRYSYTVIGAIGVNTIAYACITYGTTIIVPSSACELHTTSTQRGLLAAGPIIGLILGSGLWGLLADLFGRRRTLLISILSAAFVNVLSSFSVNWIMLLCLQFLSALLASGLFSQSMSMLSESVPVAKRNVVMLLANSISFLAQGLMAVFAIPIIPLTFSYYIPILNIHWNSWRTLQIVYSLPSLVAAGWMYYLEESPKFAYARGMHDESLEILKRIHNINYRGTREIFEVVEIVKLQKAPTFTIKEQIFPLFRLPLLKSTVIMTLLLIFQQTGAFIMWLPTISNQVLKLVKEGEGTELTVCGVLNASRTWETNSGISPCSLDVAAMLTLFTLGLIHSMLICLVSIVVNKVGRRNMVIIITTVCGLCGIVVNLVPNIFVSGILFMVFMAGFIVISLYMAMAVALFPTHLRAFALSFVLSGGRVALFASVQIINYLLENNCEFSFHLFSGIFALSALLASFLSDDSKTVKN